MAFKFLFSDQYKVHQSSALYTTERKINKSISHSLGFFSDESDEEILDNIWIDV